MNGWEALVHIVGYLILAVVIISAMLCMTDFWDNLSSRWRN